jgi:hypothetical protein
VRPSAARTFERAGAPRCVAMPVVADFKSAAHGSARLGAFRQEGCDEACCDDLGDGNATRDPSSSDVAEPDIPVPRSPPSPDLAGVACSMPRSASNLPNDRVAND